MRQLEVLNTLERNDPEGRFHCVSLREWFDYRGHVCMVFEKLGLSLYDFLRKNSYSPFPAAMVRPLLCSGRPAAPAWVRLGLVLLWQRSSVTPSASRPGQLPRYVRSSKVHAPAKPTPDPEQPGC